MKQYVPASPYMTSMSSPRTALQTVTPASTYYGQQVVIPSEAMSDLTIRFRPSIVTVKKAHPSVCEGENVEYEVVGHRFADQTNDYRCRQLSLMSLPPADISVSSVPSPLALPSFGSEGQMTCRKSSRQIVEFREGESVDFTFQPAMDVIPACALPDAHYLQF